MRIERICDGDGAQDSSEHKDSSGSAEHERQSSLAPTNLFEERGEAARLSDVRRLLSLVLAVPALALASAAAAEQAGATGTIPQRGIFIVGKTLAGVGLGYTQAQVKTHWGAGYTLCTVKPLCTASQPVWLFEYHIGEPLGVAVRFRNGKTVSVFTLGAVGVQPLSAGGGGGWKTAEGLHITDPVSNIYSLYSNATIDTQCVYYGAISIKQPGVISSFYTASGTVYGFALTAPGEPICN